MYLILNCEEPGGSPLQRGCSERPGGRCGWCSTRIPRSPGSKRRVAGSRRAASRWRMPRRWWLSASGPPGSRVVQIFPQAATSCSSWPSAHAGRTRCTGCWHSQSKKSRKQKHSLTPHNFNRIIFNNNVVSKIKTNWQGWRL